VEGEPGVVDLEDPQGVQGVFVVEDREVQVVAVVEVQAAQMVAAAEALEDHR